jgi:hypothetical protein
LTYFLECFSSLVSEYCAGGNHVATPSAATQLLTWDMLRQADPWDGTIRIRPPSCVSESWK